MRRGVARVALAMAVLIGLAVSSAGEAQACSCVPPGPPLDELARTDAVFLGRAIEVEGADMVGGAGTGYRLTGRQFRFEVLAAWKGVTTSEVIVRTGHGGGDCGYEFSPNGVYLVYGYGRAGSDTIATSICSRTAPVERAEEDRVAPGPPAVDRTHGSPWSSYATPSRCPVHPAFTLRRSHTWPILGFDDPTIAACGARRGCSATPTTESSGRAGTLRSSTTMVVACASTRSGASCRGCT